MMKKLIKLAMLGMALVGGRRYASRMRGGYGHHNAYHNGYGHDMHYPGMGHPAIGYISYKAQKKMKRKMQKRMLKHALRRIF